MKVLPKVSTLGLLTLTTLFSAGVADADPPKPPPTFGAVLGVKLLTRTSWANTVYKTKDAARSAWVKGGAKDAWELSDIVAPLDQPLKFRFEGKGEKCKIKVHVFDGHHPYGEWNDKATHALSITVDKLPIEKGTTAKALFADDPQFGRAIFTRKLRFTPVGGSGFNCTGPVTEQVVTFVATNDIRSVITDVKADPIQLHQERPGPTTKGAGFQMEIEGTGFVTAPVEVTLSGPNFPARKATLPLVPRSSKSKFPALAQGVALDAFPDLAKLPVGTHKLKVTVDGADKNLARGAKGYVKVNVAAPPPPTGATITSIAPSNVGWFPGDAQGFKLSGTPGDLGTCDSYSLFLQPMGGGNGQTKTFTKVKFPQALATPADFAPLPDGMWVARVTPSGKLCTGTVEEALAQVETPTPMFVKDRPVLTMEKTDFVKEHVKLTVDMPDSYATWDAMGANIDCCETELFYQSKSGLWQKASGTIKRGFSDWNNEDGVYDGTIIYDEFYAKPDAIEWALRVRAIGTGRQFAWSNIARFTMK